MAVKALCGLRFSFLLSVTICVLLLLSSAMCRAYSLAADGGNDNQDIKDVEDVDFYQPTPQELTQFRQLILDALGLRTVPDVSKMNVSREEFDRMQRVYQQRLTGNQRNSYNSDEDEDYTQEIVSLHPHSIVKEDWNASDFHIKRDGNGDKAAGWTLRYPLPWVFPANSRASVSQLRLRWSARDNQGFAARLSPQYAVLTLRWLGHQATTVIDGRQFLSQWRNQGLAETLLPLGDSFSTLQGSSDLEMKVECQGLFCEALGKADLISGDVEVKRWVRQGPSRRLRRLKRAHRLEDILKPKRGRTDCDKADKKRRCCRQSLKINFRNLPGFEWIVSPKVAELYMCKGKCQYPYNPANNHAIFQGFLHSRKMAPKLCCTPSKLDGLEILHLRDDDPSKLGVARWENAVVTECACA